MTMPTGLYGPTDDSGAMTAEHHIQEAERLLALAYDLKPRKVPGGGEHVRSQMEQLIILDTASVHAKLAEVRMSMAVHMEEARKQNALEADF